MLVVCDSVESLEVLEEMVRAAHEHGLIAPQIENDRYGPVPSLGDKRLPEVLVVVEIDLGVGEAVRIQSPLRARAVGADGLGEEQEVRLRGLEVLTNS